MDRPIYINELFVAFCSFFYVASLLSIGVDYEKGGVDNEKGLELDNRIIFSYFSLISIYVEISPKNATKHPIA